MQFIGGKTNPPRRDASWRVRVHSEGAVDKNETRMADAPRRVPTFSGQQSTSCRDAKRFVLGLQIKRA